MLPRRRGLANPAAVVRHDVGSNRIVYTLTMLAVTIIYNGVEWVAAAHWSGITMRGFGHTQTHACKDLLLAYRLITGAEAREYGE